ncbi:helix-turn-helix domain-containing protein [Pelosinus fermentans]|nr:LysR family transcriptional regulator [Pelosinus fermentans]
MYFSSIFVYSFSYAAKILGYAQPTVTMHIQLLEEEFQVKLFERLGLF